MSAALIIDCSVTMCWLFADEATPHTIALLDRLARETALVPEWWFLEVTNVLALAERKGRINAERSANFIAQLSKLDIEIDSEGSGRAFEHLLPMCRTNQLTSYDAMYLDLALRRRLPLATLDEPLRKAARKLGVKLLGK
jgi:predicted nucleic acid-binding protein